eukprot:scaffold26716_cov96-Isochrysis_galbana.AAC.2
MVPSSRFTPISTGLPPHRPSANASQGKETISTPSTVGAQLAAKAVPDVFANASVELMAVRLPPSSERRQATLPQPVRCSSRSCCCRAADIGWATQYAKAPDSITAEEKSARLASLHR